MDYKQTEGTELKHEWDSTWHHTMKCYSSLLLLFFSLEASTCSVCSAIQKNQYIPFIFLKLFFFYISSFNLVIWLYIFFSKQISAIYWSPMQNVQYIIGWYGNCWDNQGAKEILSPYTFGNCHINATTALRRLFPLIMGTWVCC